MNPTTEESARELVEELAELEHDRWSGWMTYLFSKCDAGEGGTLIIPEWAVARWSRQARTTYAGLSEEEKESDRAEVRKTLASPGLAAEREAGRKEGLHDGWKEGWKARTAWMLSPNDDPPPPNPYKEGEQVLGRGDV